MKSALVFGAALLATTSLANAAITVDVVNLGTPTNGTVTLTGYTAYRISLTSTTGSNITSITLGNVSGDTTSGIFATMLQRASLDPDAGTRTLTPQSSVQNNQAGTNSFDSHFLEVTPLLTFGGFIEDNTGANLPGSPNDTATSDYGTGTFLKASYSPATFAPSVAVAYVVLPSTAGAVINGFAATTDSGNPNLAFTGVIGSAPIPEPASLGVLALGGMALVARRRKA
jgi:hypothetical protein